MLYTYCGYIIMYINIVERVCMYGIVVYFIGVYYVQDWVAGCILYISSVYYLYSTVLVCVYLGD